MLLVLSLLASVVVLEGALRLVHPDGMLGAIDSQRFYPWLGFDPLLGWRNRPHHRSDEIAIDGDGLRLAAAASSGDRAATRVLCLGDSRTFGIWLDYGRFRYDNDYPRRLEELSARAGQGARIAVSNAGTLGYTADQGLRQWLVDLDRPPPDVVVAAFGLNEHLLAWDPELRIRSPSSTTVRRLLHRFGRWRLVEAALWLEKRGLGSSSPSPDGAPWATVDDYERALRRLIEDASARGVELLLLDIPLRPLARGDDLPAFPAGPGTDWSLFGAEDLADFHRIHRLYTRRMLEVARQEGAAVLRLGPVFDRHRRDHPESELFSAYDFVHPNPDGADVIAAAVLAELERRGWLETPGRGREGNRP